MRTATGQRGSRGVLGAIASLAAVGVIVTLAVTAQGYEAQEVPRLESAVWVTRDSGQYARVNTELAEIDTVRAVDDPSTVVQAGDRSVLYSQGFRQRWAVDAAAPADLVDEGADGEPLASEPTPAGTRDVVSAGPYVAYRTDTGRVFVSTVDAGAGAVPVDPFAELAVEEGEERPNHVADAVAVSPEGWLALYSAEEGAVRLFDVERHRFRGGAEPVASAPGPDARIELALLGERWVLAEAAEGRVWIAGRAEPVAVGVAADARLQLSSAARDTVLLADSAGLVGVELGSGEAGRWTDAAGVPAPPLIVAGTAHAAWVGTNGATLWSDGETRALETPADVLEAASAIAPVFRSNGDRAVLSETGTGLVWTVPDGVLIPVEQWSLDEETEQETGTVVVDDVAEQKPPVAVADSFGVRAGEQVVLPVILNDHDPNKKDVLTIDPDSIAGGLDDPGFGELSLVSNNQAIVVRVRAGAGQASFSYAVTDGAAVSEPATVTLTVVDAGQNSAPVWCGVEACTQEWPAPQLLPGGTAIVPVLSAWVDPEGDPFVLSDAHVADAEAPVTVVPMADGRVAVRHTDPNAPDAVVPIQLTVTDVHGASAEKTLNVSVTSSPALAVPPIAVTAGAGETTAIRIADHVMGGSGSFRLLDAVETAAAADGFVVAPNTASGRIEITATEPGQYLASYSVQDALTQAEQSAIVRVTVVAGGSPLSMAPLTAFVRPGEDTSVDVLSAVQNTTGRVLVVAGAVSSTPELSVGVVAQEQLRVSGTTADGQPGVIGRATVTVADGSGAAVEGVVTVFLVAPSTDTGPIALPDTVTMRAGELVRIPVTDNDVSPRGERLVVHPEVTGSGEEGELAFADGNTVRYLAPRTAGSYRLSYSVALENNPDLRDRTTVGVTVLPAGANRPPQPPILTARVLSGQSVTVPVSAYGMDPDGDRVVLTGIGQPGPGSGSATISAEGDAIVYTAPAGGVQGGQTAFDYTVRDADGAEGTGTVRVGVLDAEVADAAPVTFSDYARVQRGAATPVTIEPLQNDSDPAQGALELVELAPNAPPGNPEYERLESLIDAATSLEDGRVVLKAGDVAGTNSFVYTARSLVSSSTAQGLIVVAVTETAAADHPVVADTVLTARNRDELAQGGIDVVTGKVRWPSGDVSGLALSLWGENERYAVDGWRISGELPERGALVPFQLTGEDAAGREITSYGFLRIPAFDDMRVQLRPGLGALEVDEEKSASFAVREMLDLPSADRVEIREGPAFTVQRGNARCVPGEAGHAVYDAGREAPWSDSCLIPVRLDGQKSWSYAAVPIAILPKDPQAILASVSRTVAPGASESVELYESMTSWEGGRAGDPSALDYRAVHSGSAFLVTQSGTSVSFEARADARPGTRETVTVSVSAFGGLSAAITLVVGAAPPDAPRGATFTRQCTVSAGSCSLDVVGVAGEYDPFAGKTGAGLKLVSLGTGGAVRCDVAAVTAAGDSAVTASWPAGPQAYGGECVVPFTVADAQGRTGQGTLTIDVQGYPQRPASVATVGYTGSSVTLEVPLGEAARAHPAVTGVTVLQDGRPAAAACSSAGPGLYRCTVSGLVNGERHSFTAMAVNGVGPSAETTAHTSWAYRAPAITGASAEPVYRAGTTEQNQGVVELRIRSDPDARSFRVQETGQVFARSGGTTTAELVLAPGAQMLTIVPISQFEPPAGDAGNEGGAFSQPVTAAGRAYFSGGITTTVPNNTTIEVGGIALSANGSQRSLETVYFAWRSNEPRCEVDGAGGLSYSFSGDAVASTSSTITGLAQYRNYWVKACGSNGFGIAESERGRAATDVHVPAPGGETTYAVAPAYSFDGGRGYSYLGVTPPSLEAEGGFRVEYRIDGTWRADFLLDPDSSVGGIIARQCRDSWIGKRCSDGTTAITPVAGSAAWTAAVRFRDVCVADASELTVGHLVEYLSYGASGSASIAGTVRADDPTMADYTLSWSGAFAPLESITRSVAVCAPEPDPEPDPGPDPDPETP